jgi:hypothetical protein
MMNCYRQRQQLVCEYQSVSTKLNYLEVKNDGANSNFNHAKILPRGSKESRIRFGEEERSRNHGSLIDGIIRLLQPVFNDAQNAGRIEPGILLIGN